MIHGMNHFTVLSDNIERTLDFYVGLLGLKPGPRPDFGFPGAWLYAGSSAVLHIVGGRPLPLPGAGVIDHMAFTASSLATVQRTLDERGISYDLGRVPGSGQWQLFCYDPNGARVELDFDAS